MVTEHQLVIINRILEMDNADNVIQMLLQLYASKSIENAKLLLSLIPEIAELELIAERKVAEGFGNAAFWLIVQQELKIDKDPSSYFASMVPVCMALFPKGTAKGRSDIEKRYFDCFRQLFSDKKIFSWEKNGEWAVSNGYANYLKLVELSILSDKGGET